MTEQDEYVHPGQRFTENGYCSGHGQGMTLRDWFAGQAIMTAFKKNIEDGETLSSKNIAYDAYLIADAMMEARKK